MVNIEWLANLAEIFGGLAVILGIGFGFLEYRRHKKIERREATAMLARSFQTKEFSDAIRVMLELPEPFDSASYQKLSREDKNLVWVVLSTFEAIGLLVHRGELSIELVDDFFSVPITDGWRKLHPYVTDLRRAHGEQTWEWYQWLFERLNERHESRGRTPAHIKYGSGRKHPGRDVA